MPSTIIDLARPVALEKAKGFRRAVWIYKCPNPACRKTVRVNCNAYRGKQPDTGIGGIGCPHCATPD